MSNRINDFSDNINSINFRVNKCIGEINKVNQNGGSGNAVFIQKQCRKIADLINNLSSDLEDYNNYMNPSWNKVEQDILGLLDNKFVINDKISTKETIIALNIELKNLKEANLSNNKAVDKTIDALDTIIGFQRSLNQATRDVKDKLNSYKQLSNEINKSTDRIIIKGKLLIGDI